MSKSTTEDQQRREYYNELYTLERDYNREFNNPEIWY
jgi:hypothetical protein